MAQLNVRERGFRSRFSMSPEMVILGIGLETSMAGVEDDSGRLEAVRRATKIWTGQLVDGAVRAVSSAISTGG